MFMMVYFIALIDIEKNWPQYRCNPMFMIFSKNISEDFTYCVQNTQINLMGYLLQPFTYLISSVTLLEVNFYKIWTEYVIYSSLFEILLPVLFKIYFPFFKI